ncbi:MAG: glycine--tRNA ligase subunit beta [Candidatus Nitrospinota bacterium M3_3B_026]
MGDLLFEIGVEEIPSGYTRPAAQALKNALAESLAGWGVGFADLKEYATPRRLAALGTGIAQTRPARRTKVYGPPAKAAFGPDGKPTKAAEGFAKSRGVDVSRLMVEKTQKGEYVLVEMEEGGERTVDLLAEALPRMALGLPFPKSMIWGEGGVRFARPIHWIVALFDDEVIPMRAGKIESGRHTRGHRFLGSGDIEIGRPSEYAEKLRENHVIADIEERKHAILEGARASAEAHGASLVEDDGLAETVAFLTEWPRPLWGSFDEAFLELPEELLIASMKAHQRMFAVKRPGGGLANGFVGVSNMKTDDDRVVVAGYERVLRARLTDARFFFNEDRKHTLESFAEKLDGVIYQKKLGTIGEKARRIAALAERIAGLTRPDLVEKALRAARLCKADLETMMVYEFPELQGVMGREYARLQGEPEEVCSAIYESYLPRHSGDELPSGDLGAIVGLADRIDTITGCFGVGLEPTGDSDPFALRRHTLAVIQIIRGKGYSIPLSKLVDFALERLEGKLDRAGEEVKRDVLRFFEGRLKNLWTGAGMPADTADAVIAAGFDDLADAEARAGALAELGKRDFFEPLATTFKRVANITRGHEPGEVDEALFEEAAEERLYGEARRMEADIAPLIEDKRYLDALERIAALREPVDAFFDDVMVMAGDEALKNNRLNLLAKVGGHFGRIADFSKIAA